MPAINKQIYAVLMVVLLSIASSKGHGQWTNDPTINTPVCTTLGAQQFLPQMVADGLGGAIIAWMETTIDFSSSRIYAQHLSSTGTRLWAAAGIDVSSGSGLFSNPQVVSDGNGGAIISWVNTAGGLIRHYMQKVSATGQLQWTPGGVLVCPATVSQVLFYQLVADGHGGGTLLWDDFRAGNNQVYAQHLNANGNLQWPLNGLAVTINFTNRSSYDAVADSAGGIIICYSRNTGGLNGNDILVQHIDVNGTALWGVNSKNLSNAPIDQLYCKIAKDTNDHVIVVWQDFRLDPTWSQLVGQRIDSVGNILWQANGILLADSVSPTSTVIKIVSDTKRGAVVTWLDNFMAGQSTIAHLMGIRVDSTGSFVWTKKEIASWQELQLPADYELASDYKGGGFISWTKVQSYGLGSFDTYDLAAQHISGNGTMTYPLAGTPVSSVPMNQYYQQLTTDSSGVAIVAWSDLRNNADYDLYAMRIGGPVALPVTWISFTGSVLEQSVLLEWKTAHEWNNKGFIIQRSNNGLSFDSIGFVGAADAMQLNPFYTYTDPRPGSGINLYRLAQCDIDGRTTYSRTVRVNIVRENTLRIYPNPASKHIWVNGLNPNSMLVIYSTDGRKVMQIRSTGMTATQIDISTIPPGVYYLGAIGSPMTWMRFVKN
jgi:hypothetical protein